ncbi:MAG: PQQ-binding-like beta-propeller repeat protein [Aureliella sp.]
MRTESNRLFKTAICFAVATATAVTNLSKADDWPQWRGPMSDGVSGESSIATQWNAETNVLWKTPMPGQGGSTPVVWKDTIFVTSAKGDDLVLISLNKQTGKENWTRKVTDQNKKARAGEGNSASASPCTDGKHVWVFFSRGEKFSSGILACYDFGGQEIWKTDIAERFGKIDIQFGLSSTPVLDGDALYLQIIHGAMVRGDDTRTGKVVKLDKLTGEMIWAVDRKTDAQFENKHSYASPFMYDDGKMKFLVAHGADCTTGHDLATGKEIWRFSNLNGPTQINPGKFDFTFRFVASPCVGDGIIVIPTCKRGPTVAIKVDESLKGDIPEDSDSILWTLPKTPDVSIPLVHDDLVYLLDKSGQMRVVERDSGDEVYYERTHSTQHRSSPVYAGGHIYFFAKDGVCTVLKAGRQFNLVAKNEMGNTDITASPVVSDGILFIRTFDNLFAINAK